MLQVTKTIASLEKHEGDMNRLNVLAQLKLSEIQMSLEPYIYDSFKRLNQMMPRIMENGSKDIQLQAFILMGKVLLKMSSLNLDSTNNVPREESK